VATKTRIFIEVHHSLFKFTTTDENDGLGASVGADLRAAIGLTWATAARERDGHLEACIFIKAVFLTSILNSATYLSARETSI